jgi:predicted signal transduction protein with EAL and GGDEF domain
VETEEALAILGEFGCDRAQGYLIARPLAAGSVATCARDWQTCAAAALALRERQMALPGFGFASPWWPDGELDAIA